jgi:hypothetical protein
MVAIPSRRCLPPGLGSAAPAPATAQPPGLQVGSELGEERLLAPQGRDVVGRLAIHPGRAGALVALDPTPPNQQQRRITEEVVEVAEPTRLLIGCPSVQLGLDPSTRASACSAVGHGASVFTNVLLACQLPCCGLAAALAMWPAFPTSDYYGGSVPSGDQQPTAGLPATGLDSRRGGQSQDGSHVHHQPVDGVGAQLFPGSLATGTPQTFPVASWPASSTGVRVALPRCWSGVRCCPAPIRQLSSRFLSCGVPPLVPAIRTPSPLACRARAVWQRRPESSRIWWCSW